MKFLHVQVCLLLFCGARFSAGPAVAAATPPAGDVVELPAYTVTDSRELPPPERWSYARIEGFEVLSNASERATRDILQHFRRFSQALDVVWPGIQRPAAVPAVLVICGRGGKFDQFLPKGDDAQLDRGKISLALRTREQSAIVVDYEAKVLDLAAPGEAPREVEVDAHQQLSREYIRFLFGNTHAPFPEWFVEGIAQILMAMDVSKTNIIVGQLEDPELQALLGGLLPAIRAARLPIAAALREV